MSGGLPAVRSVGEEMVLSGLQRVGCVDLLDAALCQGAIFSLYRSAPDQPGGVSSTQMFVFYRPGINNSENKLYVAGASASASQLGASALFLSPTDIAKLPLSSVDVSKLVAVTAGKVTPELQAVSVAAPADLCFYVASSEGVALSLSASSKLVRDHWVERLRSLMGTPKGTPVGTSLSPTAASSAAAPTDANRSRRFSFDVSDADAFAELPTSCAKTMEVMSASDQTAFAISPADVWRMMQTGRSFKLHGDGSKTIRKSQRPVFVWYTPPAAGSTGDAGSLCWCDAKHGVSPPVKSRVADSKSSLSLAKVTGLYLSDQIPLFTPDVKKDRCFTLMKGITTTVNLEALTPDQASLWLLGIDMALRRCLRKRFIHEKAHFYDLITFKVQRGSTFTPAQRVAALKQMSTGGNGKSPAVVESMTIARGEGCIPNPITQLFVPAEPLRDLGQEKVVPGATVPFWPGTATSTTAAIATATATASASLTAAAVPPSALTRLTTHASWSQSDVKTWCEVRQKNYLVTKTKAASEQTFFECLSVDVYRRITKLTAIGHLLHLPETKTDDVVKGMKSFLIISMALPESYRKEDVTATQRPPDGPGFIFAMVFRLTSYGIEQLEAAVDGPAKLLRQFLSSNDNDPIRNRLKMFGHLANLHDAEQQIGARNASTYKANAGRPWFTGPQHTFTRGKNYLEIGLDVHRYEAMARLYLNKFLPVLSALVIDLAWVVEAQTEAELPEQVMCAVRLAHLNPKHVDSLSILMEQQQKAALTIGVPAAPTAPPAPSFFPSAVHPKLRIGGEKKTLSTLSTIHASPRARAATTDAAPPSTLANPTTTASGSAGTGASAVALAKSPSDAVGTFAPTSASMKQVATLWRLNTAKKTNSEMSTLMRSAQIAASSAQLDMTALRSLHERELADLQAKAHANELKLERQRTEYAATRSALRNQIKLLRVGDREVARGTWDYIQTLQSYVTQLSGTTTTAVPGSSTTAMPTLHPVLERLLKVMHHDIKQAGAAVSSLTDQVTASATATASPSAAAAAAPLDTTLEAKTQKWLALIHSDLKAHGVRFDVLEEMLTDYTAAVETTPEDIDAAAVRSAASPVRPKTAAEILAAAATANESPVTGTAGFASVRGAAASAMGEASASRLRTNSKGLNTQKSTSSSGSSSGSSSSNTPASVSASLSAGGAHSAADIGELQALVDQLQAYVNRKK